MKKLLSIVLVTALLVCAFCIPARAMDDETLKEYSKLVYLFQSIPSITLFGDGQPYYRISSEYDAMYENAEKVRNPNLSAEDYRQASEEIIDYVKNKQIIKYDYAYRTYLNALEETNEAGWYDEALWNDFQASLVQLKAALDAIDGDATTAEAAPACRELTDAFHAVLRAYNLMTNTGAKAGDVNGDGYVTIDDATLVQLALAEFSELSGSQKMRASVYKNREYEKVGIGDVTQMQRYIAEFSDSPAERNDREVLISEMQTNPLISEDYLTERAFNFNICPRYDEPDVEDQLCGRVPNGFYSAKNFMTELSSQCELDIFAR